MRKLATMMRQHAFHLLLLFVALVVFCKPVLLASPDDRPMRVVLELFLPWAGVIVILFWISHSLSRASDGGEGAGAGERE